MQLTEIILGGDVITDATGLKTGMLLLCHQGSSVGPTMKTIYF